MMHGPRHARMNLDCRHQPVFRQTGGNDKVLIHIGTVGGNVKWFGHAEHEVRFFQLPAIVENRSGQQPGDITERSARRTGTRWGIGDSRPYRGENLATTPALLTA